MITYAVHTSGAKGPDGVDLSEKSLRNLRGAADGNLLRLSV